ncbi:winged helix-turn-helix transcriptional regulator [Clostridium luticellarii]|jgi:DNA-binding HxlR family transcriptional regulator|uniref:HTH-type transcriptional activator HxlR n=1 Tax=Clostridium luticellarii TaxID=1691940 RepID=A0A2T0BSS4_9CLOT|nr:helix-turn-helix domain-containing protein [Clostridium luticellarii]MCI1945621.1 helix-turn-helix transcriptional regulator [Clostridium luticellarii]MCI1969407.1 helix-turn-helix transcriptional regulator [Clostridium luticellarii]MCI1996467.1 helix-turn-helix transcriptional regulator [Clostridium luticellarii]MCI2040820.1 helix-turn-helix transcriptional regulator [Clostridium luticellarii]PRR86923.1 HTH-type transcriptional activator HxlR [Clostridium luticellarii]
MKSFDCKYGNCPLYYTISVVGGKWKWILLWKLYEFGVVRYNKLKTELEPIAHKTLSRQLKELEKYDLIHREQYNQIPPKVEYSLTEEGKTLVPILKLMHKWGKDHVNKQIHNP